MLAIFKEALDYGQTRKAVCDARYLSGTDFVRIVPCGAGAARMCECVLAEVYERREGLSRRSDVPSRCTCSSSGLRPGLYRATVIADAVTLSGRVVALPLLVTSYRETGSASWDSLGATRRVKKPRAARSSALRRAAPAAPRTRLWESRVSLTSRRGHSRTRPTTAAMPFPAWRSRRGWGRFSSSRTT